MTPRVNPLPIAVLMVTWNSADVLPTCLGAIAASKPPPAELIVIDNASHDASADTVEHFASTLDVPTQVLRLISNTGFAAGMNRAISASTAPFVFLLNPDARLQPDALARLYERMLEADEAVYAVGPKLRRATGASLAATDIIDSTGIEMTRDGRHFDRGADKPDDGRYDETEEVFGISGAAVLLRRSALEDALVDGQIFDEDFFAYREDVDLAWRMRGYGYRAVYEPAAIVYHQRRATPSRRRSLPASINYHSVKNRFLLRIHHADRSWLLSMGIRSFMRDAIVVAACIGIERSSLPAFPWLLRNARRHLGRRREILGRRSVSSRSLQRWFR
jgi:GT2 family glycosyltransferase